MLEEKQELKQHLYEGNGIYGKDFSKYEPLTQSLLPEKLTAKYKHKWLKLFHSKAN